MTNERSPAAKTGKRSPRGSEPGTSGKERLIKAAERLFGERGFASVSAAELAREAEVAHGLLFHHFGSMQELYIEVSRRAAQQMDVSQLRSFKGATAREKIEAFLRVHMRTVKQRQGDAIFRARSHDSSTTGVADIWEQSRLRAIDKVLEVLGVQAPSRKAQVALRAWIAFHDQLMLAWLTDRSLSEAEVLRWSMQQLEPLVSDVLGTTLDTPC